MKRGAVVDWVQAFILLGILMAAAIVISMVLGLSAENLTSFRWVMALFMGAMVTGILLVYFAKAHWRNRIGGGF